MSGSWLSDTTANRYIKTYFKDWIDVNGDVKVRNNIIFNDGTTQNTASSADSWINKNIVDSPPAIVFNTSYPSTSSMIYVSWSYPAQVEIGMLNLYLPLISAFNATWTASINGTITTNNIITNDSTTNTIKFNGQTETTNYITGIVLTNINTNTGYQTITFPGEAFSRRCYVAYSSDFANLQDDTNNKITCWYTNYQSITNPSYTHFNIFLQAGAPSAPGQPTFGSQTTDNSGVNVVATTSVPQYTDELNQNNIPAIQKYRMNKSSTGSTLRYGGAIADSSTWIYGSGTSNIISLNGLFPDSTYSIYSQAQNNSTNTNYGTSSTTATLNTTYLTAPSTYGSISFSLTSYSAKLVSSGSSVSNVLFSNPGPITSNSIVAPIHYVGTRGSTASGLLKFNIDIVRGSTNVETGSNVKYNGYPILAPTSLSTSNISINTSAPTDAYTATALTGYYLNCSNTVTLKSPVFVASNNQTVVTLTQTQYQANGTTVNNTNTSTYPFYFDTYSGNPSITSITIGGRSFTTTPISGVYIVNSNVGLNVTTILTNIGTYFFNNSHILTYDNSTGQSETDLTYFTAGSKNSTNLLYPVTITNNSTVYQSYQTFSLGTSLIVTAYGPTNSNTSTTSNVLKVILDEKTLTLTYPSVGSSYVGNGSNNNTGWRIGSGIATTIGTSSYVTALPPSAVYGSTAYDNTQLLTANQDLQLFDGKYRSKGTTTQGYLDYSTYYKDTSTFNSANYSTITATGYRYCTFVWRVSTNASNYTKVQFNLNSCLQNVNNPDALPTINTTRLYIYYRIEDTANYTQFTAAYRNTTWIDINNNANGITSGNYYNNAVIIDGKNTTSGYNNTYSNGTYTVNGLTQSFSVGASDTVYLYLRICVPMNEDFGFSNVTATLI